MIFMPIRPPATPTTIAIITMVRTVRASNRAVAPGTTRYPTTSSTPTADAAAITTAAIAILIIRSMTSTLMPCACA